MSLVDVDSWLMEYEACEKLQHTISTQLAQREIREPRSNEYNRLTAAIQVALKQYENELQQLRQKLNSPDTQKSSTYEELERRQEQVNKLATQLVQLQKKFRNSTRHDRAQLLSTPTSSATALGGADGGDNVKGGPPADMDVATLKQRQIEILEQQNRGLEALSQTISRQRALATQIGQEVEDQNDILDNLANTMESVDARVHIETGNIGHVNRQDSTFSYWLVIILLFIAIMLVVILL